MTIRGKTRYVAVVAAALLVACSGPGGELDDPPPDPEDGEAFSGGKADETFGDCHLEHVLLVVNDPGLEVEELTGLGVHPRAARNIVDFRSGDDGDVGTEADRYFESARRLDDVDYVGPVAIQQLADGVVDYCDDGPWREAEPVFSPSPYTEGFVDRVVDEIEGADESIDMAMYRLSDNRVKAALEEAADRGVEIRMLFDGANGDHLDKEGSTSAGLEDRGIDVRYVNRNIHHKFAIVDGPHDRLIEAADARVFTGSANLQFSAVTEYDDNVVFHRGDPAVVLDKQREFNRLWNHSRNFAWNDELEYFETMEIDPEMVPPRQDLEVLWTSSNFEKTDSERWGPGFRPESFSRKVADRIVELIEEADSSIRVAAAYLRMRPIAEALEHRALQDPDLDIQIYLDQTEYLSQADYDDQQSQLEECLVEAGDDEEEIYDCRQRGLLFSYDLVDAGIDVRFKSYAYRWHYTYARQMHHKYLIVDESTVATGSYNYSMNAEQNTMDNVVVYRAVDYPELVEAFVDNFDEIRQTGRADGGVQALETDVEEADVIELIFEPVALTWDEKTGLRETIRQRCPEVDSEEFRQDPTEHDSCEVE